MYAGLYAASSNMGAIIHQQDVIASNLANASVSGFKAERVAFRSFPDILFEAQAGEKGEDFDMGPSGRVGTGAGVDWVYSHFAPGRIKETGVATDLLVQGDAYFTVRTADDNEYLTRGGGFLRQHDGTLTTPSGYVLLDTNRQPVQVHDSFTVDTNGRVITQGRQALPDGTFQEVAQTVQLLMQTVDDPNILKREPGASFSVEPQFQERLQESPAGTFSVTQGALEESNVSVILESTRLISAYRNYESSSKVLNSIDRTIERLVNDVGRASG